jgi:pSer/pThr/pTyr-binding forkhead associated (FHA) protein
MATLGYAAERRRPSDLRLGTPSVRIEVSVGAEPNRGGEGRAMNADLGQFLEACGASGPLRLEWDDWETGRPVRRDFERPVVLVGHNPQADLVLDHPLVGRRHAYFQLVEGRLFAIDLGSRQGLRWGGVPRPRGWIDRSRPVQVGVTTIRVVEGDRIEDGGPGPGPTSRRYESRRSLPRAVIEFRGGGQKRRTIPLERVLTLVGGSQHCAVRLTGPGISRFICGLLRTPVGVWAIDLLSSRGLAINGVHHREALLEDSDILRVGELDFRVTYVAPTSPPGPAALPQTARSVLGPEPDRPGDDPLASVLIDRPEVLLSEATLRPLLEGGESAAGLASSPFGQALVLLIRLLGDMHRDHLELVREELQQIRRIHVEMNATRAALGRPEPERGGQATSAGGAAEGSVPRPEPGAAHPHLVDPEAIQCLVGERLAAWEEERRGRWQRVIELLVKR